jgi:hypothetical protein
MMMLQYPFTANYIPQLGFVVLLAIMIACDFHYEKVQNYKVLCQTC